MGVISRNDDEQPDPDELIREGYQREATLLGRADAAEAEAESLRQQLEGAVDLLREIGAMAGAKANGADARAMAKRAREYVASLDHLRGQ